MKVTATKNGITITPETAFEKEFMLKRFCGNTERATVLSRKTGEITVWGITASKTIIH